MNQNAKNRDVGNYVVHGDKTRPKPYYVTWEKLGTPTKTVYESKSGSDALQWAINHTNIVEVDGQIQIDHGAVVVGKRRNTVVKKK